MRCKQPAHDCASRLQAQKQAKTFFQFQGKGIKLSPLTAVFGTMNPSFPPIKDMPENLQSMLWPVAMMQPDTALIGEVALLCSGFTNCKVRCMTCAIYACA